MKAEREKLNRDLGLSLYPPWINIRRLENKVLELERMVAELKEEVAALSKLKGNGLP